MINRIYKVDIAYSFLDSGNTRNISVKVMAYDAQHAVQRALVYARGHIHHDFLEKQYSFHIQVEEIMDTVYIGEEL